MSTQAGISGGGKSRGFAEERKLGDEGPWWVGIGQPITVDVSDGDYFILWGNLDTGASDMDGVGNLTALGTSNTRLVQAFGDGTLVFEPESEQSLILHRFVPLVVF